MVGIDAAQIQAQALQRLRAAAGRPDIDFQIIVTSRPVPHKWLLVAILVATTTLAWWVPSAFGIDMTFGLTGRRTRALPTVLLAVVLSLPWLAVRTWSLGFCKDGSVLLARNGFSQGIDVVQTLPQPEIVLEEAPPVWRPPRIGVGEWVWQVNFNDSTDRVPAWLRSRSMIDTRPVGSVAHANTASSRPTTSHHTF